MLAACTAVPHFVIKIVFCCGSLFGCYTDTPVTVDPQVLEDMRFDSVTEANVESYYEGFPITINGEFDEAVFDFKTRVLQESEGESEEGELEEGEGEEDDMVPAGVVVVVAQDEGEESGTLEWIEHRAFQGDVTAILRTDSHGREIFFKVEVIARSTYTVSRTEKYNGETITIKAFSQLNRVYKLLKRVAARSHPPSLESTEIDYSGVEVICWEN